MPFSRIFGEDPAENQARWKRDHRNPIIRPGADWCAEFIAPSSLLADGARITLFVEGGDSERESIGAYVSDQAGNPTASWTACSGNPLLRPASAGFDRGSVFDPAVTSFGGAVSLYYSATAGSAHEFAELADADADAEGPAEQEWIGVARRTAHRFDREASPVLEGRCPCVVEWEGRLYLFYVKVVRGGYRIFLATSDDGQRFTPRGSQPVLDVGRPGDWDSYTVTTPKVFRDEDHFTMLYAGDASRIDDPTAVGIAVSDDLVSWSKHPGNPVFTTGNAGEFDCVSVASTVPLRCPDGWQILYAGSDTSIDEGLHSQIGRAWLGGSG